MAADNPQEIQLATGDVTTRQIGTELNVLHRSKSPYIVKFYGCFLAQTSVYYCMEYMDYGSLDRLYLGGVPEPVLSRIASAVVQGLWYMSKELNVMHRGTRRAPAPAPACAPRAVSVGH